MCSIVSRIIFALNISFVAEDFIFFWGGGENGMSDGGLIKWKVKL